MSSLRLTLSSPIFLALAAVPTFPPAGPEPHKLSTLEGLLARLLNLATGLAGLAILVMFLVGGFQLLTAGNDKEAAQKAQNTLTAAALGGAGLILIWLLLLFIKEFTGLDVTEFEICIKPPC